VGLFCFASLRVNGRMVAFNLSLETADAHYLLKLGHDVELASASPGTLLTAAMIERAFSLGMKSYEFLGDADPYKLRWTQRCREFVQAQSFAHTPTGLIDQIAQTEGRAIARRLTRWGRR
jgi:CelD/BcsL family acetyltransferase involved in cellulose biosynthesis